MNFIKITPVHYDGSVGVCDYVASKYSVLLNKSHIGMITTQKYGETIVHTIWFAGMNHQDSIKTFDDIKDILMENK